MSTSTTLAWIPLVLAFFFEVTSAAVALQTRQTITALGSSQISAFKPYSYYASTGYCEPTATLAWNCGSNCETNLSFKPVASGGDGDSVQFCMF